MAQCVRQDVRLRGAEYVAVISEALPIRIAVSCPCTRSVAIVSLTYTTTVKAVSAELSGEPGCLIYEGSYLWTVTDGGKLLKLNPTTLAVSATIDAQAERNTWLTSARGFIIVPGPTGSLRVYNTAGTRVGGVDGFTKIEGAVASGNYVYVFDGEGYGYVVSISAAGVAAVVERFAAPNVRGITRVKAVSAGIVVVSVRFSTVTLFDISDPTAPIVDTRTKYAPGAIQSVNTDAALTPAGDEEQAAFGLSWWWGANDAVSIPSGEIVLHGDVGRVSMPDDDTFMPLAWDPAHVYSPGGPTLSSGNRTVTYAGSTAGNPVRSINTHATGKYYAEFTIDSAATSLYGPVFGIIGFGYPTNEFIGSGSVGVTPPSAGWLTSFNLGLATPGALVGPQPGFYSAIFGQNAVHAGDVVSVLVDLDSNQLIIWLNGVSLGALPAPAPNPGWNTVIVPGTVYHLAVDSQGYGFAVTANFGSPETPFIYAMPAGYSEWGRP
jgi:hypothetical protein